MGRYTFTIETEGGVATSDVLDRVAEVLDVSDVLLSPAIALDDAGALTFNFEVEAPGAMEASQLAVRELADAIRVARGLEVVDVSAELDVELPVSRLELEAVA